MLLDALTVLVSAFLLFQAQPTIAKIILPWFGGSAAVWTTCLLFFQVGLLLGYLYAHALVRYLKPRAQAGVHAVLLLGSALALPAYPSASWRPSSAQDPVFAILGLLTVTIGPPYFLLASTGPLLQAWYARRFHGAMPYRLYALSNAGSLFALLSYPALFEPFFTTHRQAGMWSAAYVVFIALCGVAAIRSGSLPAIPAATDSEPEERPGTRRYAMWLLLPACASALLLAITNYLSQDVAAIPLLWVLPLSVYLLSFILCFEGGGWYHRNPYLQLLAASLGIMTYVLVQTTTNRTAAVKAVVPLFCLGLFVCCMVCHGELARLKPHPRYLTHFYLTISAGGALGGILVGLAAPRVFHAYYELPIGLVACPALVLAALRLDPELTGWFRGWRAAAPAAGALATVVMAGYLGFQIDESLRHSRVLARNFYGGLRVWDSGPAGEAGSIRTFVHGAIVHGEEYLDPARRLLPTTYFGPQSGVGIAIREKQKAGAVRVGVIGLGAGTLAAYGRPGDFFRFYEINPLVTRIARSEFYFLSGCAATLDIVMGDARLSLDREASQNFDVLAMDAFSGDSPPVHLLTREAMLVYFRHLKPDGILAVNISNRYLDLQPVVEGEGRALGKISRVIETGDDESQAALASAWVLVSSPTAGLDAVTAGGYVGEESPRRVRLWTDDYSNLFQILK
jgi:SAM-dependent methyltransferase